MLGFGRPDASPAGGDPSQQDSGGKVDPGIAGYEDDGDRCENCSYFQAPSDCSVVNTQVQPQGWCKLHSDSDDQGSSDSGYGR